MTDIDKEKSKLTWLYRASSVSLLAVSMGPTYMQEGPCASPSSLTLQAAAPLPFAETWTKKGAPADRLVPKSLVVLDPISWGAVEELAPAIKRLPSSLHQSVAWRSGTARRHGRLYNDDTILRESRFRPQTGGTAGPREHNIAVGVMWMTRMPLLGCGLSCSGARKYLLGSRLVREW